MKRNYAVWFVCYFVSNYVMCMKKRTGNPIRLQPERILYRLVSDGDKYAISPIPQKVKLRSLLMNFIYANGYGNNQSAINQ